MALLIVGAFAATAGVTAYAVKKTTSRSRYQTFAEDDDPRFSTDLLHMDPDSRKSLTKYYSIEYPEILVGWRVRLCDGRLGTVLNCRRRFMRAAIFDISLTDKTLTDAVVLNRKNKKNRKKYMDFDLVSKEF